MGDDCFSEPVDCFVVETHYLQTLYSSEDGAGQSLEPSVPPQDHVINALQTDKTSLPRPISSPHSIAETEATERVSPEQYPSWQARPLSAIPLESVVSLAAREHPEGRVAFPLHQEREVRLMKYYIDYMCHWFDLCDTRGNNFGQELPKRAIESATLLNAIFAVSSRHLSIIGQFDPFASDRYHQDCLEHLRNIPLNDPALRNDDLLAATILLRTLEELDVPLVGQDYQGHLLGIQVFMNAQDPSIPASGFRQASFWIGLRQDIYMAFVNQRPLKTKLDHSFIDRTLLPADDDTWAKRILINTAEIENFCFGDNEQPVSTYRRLREYDERWLEARPLSFLPLSYRAPNRDCGEMFPEIWNMNHAVGKVNPALQQNVVELTRLSWSDRYCTQYYWSSSTDVLQSYPSTNRTDIQECITASRSKIDPPFQTKSERLTPCKEDIRKQIRELCGTALSNRRTIPALFTACMGVTMCGDRFSDRAEQEALLNVLVITEADHAWPTSAAQLHLKRAWGWGLTM